MKFTVDQEYLFSALQKVQSVVEKKNTVQILANILCSVKGNELSLYATDLEVGIKVSMPVTGPTDGKITLSAKNFLDIVKELPNMPVNVSKKSNGWIEIVSGKSKFNIVGLAADEYPAVPEFESKEYFEAKAENLSLMVDQTSFAVSTDATRYHLNGVYFEKLENNLIRMTATDGHRLAFVDQEVFLKTPEMKRGMIIPKKGVGELKKILEETGEKIELAFDRGHIFAKTAQTYLYVRLIEGEYPDYKQVIPKKVDKLAVLPKAGFHAALKRVSLIAHEKSKSVKMSFQPGLLVISSSNPDIGDAREELEVQYDGEALEIGFNAKYILDALPAIDSETLDFQFKDRLNPGIFQGSNQKSYTYIVMPMRI